MSGHRFYFYSLTVPRTNLSYPSNSPLEIEREQHYCILPKSYLFQVIWSYCFTISACDMIQSPFTIIDCHTPGYGSHWCLVEPMENTYYLFHWRIVASSAYVCSTFFNTHTKPVVLTQSEVVTLSELCPAAAAAAASPQNLLEMQICYRIRNSMDRAQQTVLTSPPVILMHAQDWRLRFCLMIFIPLNSSSTCYFFTKPPVPST